MKKGDIYLFDDKLGNFIVYFKTKRGVGVILIYLRGRTLPIEYRSKPRF